MDLTNLTDVTETTDMTDTTDRSSLERRRAARQQALIDAHPLNLQAGVGIPWERFGLADVHMHTHYSDGTGTVEETLEHVQRATPLDVIAITDHDTITGALRARDLMAKRDYRFELIVGEEVSTREGHMLALFIEKRIPPGLSIERSIDLVHEQGGLAIVAHPFNRIFRYSVQKSVMDRLFRQPDVHPDGVESLNGSFAGIGSSQTAMRLTRQLYGWTEVGGSDAHTPSAIGCAHTRFVGSGAEGLREAIVRGETAPAGRFWRSREYLVIVSHHAAFGRARMYATQDRPAVRAAGLRALAFGWSARAAERYVARRVFLVQESVSA
jgi:predicted metal-dependent phosphoesterase TrpH